MAGAVTGHALTAPEEQCSSPRTGSGTGGRACGFGMQHVCEGPAGARAGRRPGEPEGSSDARRPTPPGRRGGPSHAEPSNSRGGAGQVLVVPVRDRDRCRTAVCPGHPGEPGALVGERGTSNICRHGGETVSGARTGYRGGRPTRHPPDDDATAPRNGSSSRGGRHRHPCASVCSRSPRPPWRPRHLRRWPCARRWPRRGRTPA